MPRKGKGSRTLSGADAQGAKPAVGVPYGEGERRLESQRRMPLPSGPPPVPGTGGGTPGGGSAGVGSPTGPPPDFEQALAAAQGMEPPQSVLETPTARPNEPVTTGLGGALTPQGAAVNEGLYNLRALAQRYPYPDLLNLIARVEAEL